MKNKKQNERQEALKPPSFENAVSDVKNTVKSLKTSDAFAFSKSNYTLMIIGIAVIMAGFFIMTMDKEDFGFGFLGLTLGPIIAFVGFLLEFYAILKK
jgi:Protein of unknown function (DUF3098)